MRRVVVLLIIALFFVAVGCNGGYPYGSRKNLQATLVVKVERILYFNPDESLTIYANGFSQNEDQLKFTCPCYFGRNDMDVVFVTPGDSFVLKLLPGAAYNVKLRHLVSEPK